jgi:hypothetical protein
MTEREKRAPLKIVCGLCQGFGRKGNIVCWMCRGTGAVPLQTFDDGPCSYSAIVFPASVSRTEDAS